MKQEVTEILAELRRERQSLYGERLEHIVLFGSQARGDAEPDSDIDVLVVLKGAVEPGVEIDRTSHFGLTFSKHSGVIAAFGHQFAKTGRVPKEFHRYVIDGERKRLTGDYDIGPGLSEQETLEQIDRAEKFLDLAKASLASPP